MRVGAVFVGFGFLAGNDRGREGGFAAVARAEGRAQAGRLSRPLGDDIRGSGQSLVGRGDLAADEAGGHGVGVGARHDHLGQGLEAAFAGDSGAGAPPWAVRKVQVLEGCRGGGFLERAAQLVGHAALLFDGADDGEAALVEGCEPLQLDLDVAYGYLVEASGHFLAVAADEGHCCT